MPSAPVVPPEIPPPALGRVKRPAPARPIEGGLPTEALVAHVVVSKYADHQPLYRQAQIYSPARALTWIARRLPTGPGEPPSRSDRCTRDCWRS